MFGVFVWKETAAGGSFTLARGGGLTIFDDHGRKEGDDDW